MDIGTQSESQVHDLKRTLTISGTIIGTMAIGAAIACLIALSPPLKLLGFFVAFMMMTFIGMPLVLASIADARESH